MALEIPQWHFMWYNRTTVCPYPWKGMSTGPGGLAALHITERWNYLQTPDSGGLFFAFSGAVYGLRKRIAKTFLKTCRKTLNSPNFGQQEHSLLYRLESCLSRQSICFCRGPGLGSQHLDGDFETACNSSSKVSNVLFWPLWTPGTCAMLRHTCRRSAYKHKNKRDISKNGEKERQKRKKEVAVFLSRFSECFGHSLPQFTLYQRGWALTGPFFCSFVLHNSVSLEIWFCAPLCPFDRW